MNSNSLQYDDNTNASIEIPELQKKGFFNVIITKVISYLKAGGLEKFQAWHRTKRERTAQDQQPQDIIGSLPVEEKLRLGMYRFMG